MAVTAAQVRAYADLPASAVLADSTVELYLAAADLIINEDLAGTGLSAERLDVIKLNLASHFAVISNEKGGFASETVGESTNRYRVLSDKLYGLSSTRFGQVAISLDTSGTLTKLSTSPLKALIEVI
jgi:hypothetical protein